MMSQSSSFWQRLLIGRHPLKTLVRAAVIAGFCIVTFRFAFVPVYVKGDSMLPTYRNGQFGFANRLAFNEQDPQMGDVVVIEMIGRRTMYLKRVVGLSGDTVEFRNGLLFVNGQHHPEPYVEDPGDWTVPPEQLGPLEYYVVGDNRSMPWHWQTMGIVHRDHIVGRIMF